MVSIGSIVEESSLNSNNEVKEFIWKRSGTPRVVGVIAEVGIGEATAAVAEALIMFVSLESSTRNLSTSNRRSRFSSTND